MKRLVKPTTLDVCTTVIGTDSQFMAGTTRDDGFGTDHRTRKKVHANARAAGINPVGKKWVPSLVPLGEQNSPKGLVDGRGDVVKRCQEMGASCEGRINVKGHTPDGPSAAEAPYEVAQELIDEDVNEIVERDHGGKVSKKKRQQIEDDARTLAMPSNPKAMQS